MRNEFRNPTSPAACLQSISAWQPGGNAAGSADRRVARPKSSTLAALAATTLASAGVRAARRGGRVRAGEIGDSRKVASRIPGWARGRGAVVDLVPDRPRGSARAGGLSQMLAHSHGSSRSSRGTDECAASSVLPFRTNTYLVPHATCAGSTCSVQCRAERTHP